MKKETIEVVYHYQCDYCSKKHSQKTKTTPKEWVVLTVTKSDKLRLYEKEEPTPRYESFHIPNKKQITYCSTTCANKAIKEDMELFVAESLPRRAKHTN